MLWLCVRHVYYVIYFSQKLCVGEGGKEYMKNFFLFGYNGDIVHLSNLNSHKIPVR